MEYIVKHKRRLEAFKCNVVEMDGFLLAVGNNKTLYNVCLSSFFENISIMLNFD